MSKPNFYFPALDGLRTIACAFVLVSHLIWEKLEYYIQGSKVYQESYFIQDVLHFFLKNGSFGVHIFFVLSGFLITYLLLSEKAETGNINIPFFFYRRILRIWPVYFIVLGMAFMLYPALKSLLLNSEAVITERAYLYYLFLGNFDLIRILQGHEYAVGMISVTWSVSIEEQFYILWPWLFVFFNKKHLPVLFGAVIFFSVAFNAHYSNDLYLNYYHTFSNFLYLSIGGLTAYLLFTDRLPERVKTINSVHRVLFLGFLLFFLIFAYRPLQDVYLGRTIYAIISALFCACFILEQVLFTKAAMNFSRFTFLCHLGKYTYGLYMYHRIVDWILSNILPRYENNLAYNLAVSVTTIVLTFCISWVSYEFVEKWFLKQRHKFFGFSKAKLA